MPTAEPRISLVLPAKNQVLKGQATASAEAWRRDRVCLSGSVLCSGCIVHPACFFSQGWLVGAKPLLDWTRPREARKERKRKMEEGRGRREGRGGIRMEGGGKKRGDG